MYQFQFALDFEDLVVFNRVYGKTSGKKIKRSLTAFTVLAADLIVIVAHCAAQSFGFHLWLMLVIATTLGIVISNAQFPTVSARATKRMQVESIGELTMTLDTDGVREQSIKCDSLYPWASLVAAYHSRGRYVLFLDPKHAIILPERALTQGDIATLKAFLEEKLHKEVKEIP